MVTPVRVAYADRVWEAGVRTGGQAAAGATQTPCNERALSSSPPAPQDTIFPYDEKRSFVGTRTRRGLSVSEQTGFLPTRTKGSPQCSCRVNIAFGTARACGSTTQSEAMRTALETKVGTEQQATEKKK